jgi:collagen triple helix repeat protein
MQPSRLVFVSLLAALSSCSGTAGPEGPSGPSGPSGPATGVQGPSGPSGPSGPAGATGPTGATGASGPSGPAGPTGPSGPSGPTGATGASGPAGPAGASGPPGPSGPPGATGPSGPPGATGPTGSSGPSGPTGPTGPTGATGPSGPAGATGPIGATGPSGPSGPTGPGVAFAPLVGKAALLGGATGGTYTVSLDGTAFTTTTTTGAFGFPSVPQGIYSLSISNGAYGDSVPGVVVAADGDFLIDGSLWDLPTITLPRATRVTHSEAAAGGDWGTSPDGKWLAYVERDNGDGTVAMAVQALPSGPSMIVGNRVQPYSGWIWTSDSARFLFVDAWDPILATGTFSYFDAASHLVMPYVYDVERIAGLTPDGLEPFIGLRDAWGYRSVYYKSWSAGAAVLVGVDYQPLDWFPAARTVLLRYDIGSGTPQVRALSLATRTLGAAVVGHGPTRCVRGVNASSVEVEVAYCVDQNPTASASRLRRLDAATLAVTELSGLQALLLGGADGKARNANRITASFQNGSARELRLLFLTSGTTMPLATDAAYAQFMLNGTRLVVADNTTTAPRQLKVFNADGAQLGPTYGGNVVLGPWPEANGIMAFQSGYYRNVATDVSTSNLVSLPLATGTAGVVNFATAVSIGQTNVVLSPDGSAAYWFDWETGAYRVGRTLRSATTRTVAAPVMIATPAVADASGNLPDLRFSTTGPYFFRISNPTTGAYTVCRNGTAAGYAATCDGAGGISGPDLLLAAGGTPMKSVLYLSSYDQATDTGIVSEWLVGSAAPVRRGTAAAGNLWVSPDGSRAIAYTSWDAGTRRGNPWSLPLVAGAGTTGGFSLGVPADRAVFGVDPATGTTDHAVFIANWDPIRGSGQLVSHNLRTGSQIVTAYYVTVFAARPNAMAGSGPLDRLYAVDEAGHLITAAGWMGAAKVIASGLDAGFDPAHHLVRSSDRAHVAFVANRASGLGTLIVHGEAGTGTTTAILPRVQRFQLAPRALGGDLLLASHASSPAPFSYQDGLYVAPLP